MYTQFQMMMMMMMMSKGPHPQRVIATKERKSPEEEH